MAEAILQKVKVDRSSPVFEWVSKKEMAYKQNPLSVSQRNDEYNAIVCLALLNLNSSGVDVNQLSPEEIVLKTAAYMPVLFTMYCQITLIKMGHDINDLTIANTLAKQIEKTDLANVFLSLTLQKQNNDNRQFMLDPVIDHYSFGLDKSVSFVESFLTKKVLPFKDNIEVITELKEGAAVCGYTLVKLISKKPHSEVWQASGAGGRKVALKMEPLDVDEKEYKKLTSTSGFGKLLEYIKSTDIEWNNYSKLKDFPYKVNYFNIDYYSPLRLKVKIMSWLDGPINRVAVEDKKLFIYAMYEIAFELHKRGLMFNGFSPNHIMIKTPIPGEEKAESVKTFYRLVDYKYITSFKGSDTNLHSEYKSLSLLSGTNSVNEYDDIESILYTFNELIAGKNLYIDKQNEYLKKSELSSYANLVSSSITNLRILRQNDAYVNGLAVPEDYNSYIISAYESGIKQILVDVYNNFNEVSTIEISLVPSDFALLQKIKINVAGIGESDFLALHQNPTKMNEVCLAILNFMVHGTEASIEFQPYVIRYLNM